MFLFTIISLTVNSILSILGVHPGLFSSKAA